MSKVRVRDDAHRVLGLTSVANHTKWDELRLAMHDLPTSPGYRCQDVNGYYSDPDFGWYYRFLGDGYETLHWVDIEANDPDQRVKIHEILRCIHMAGEETDYGFRVYGYAQPGQALAYF